VLSFVMLQLHSDQRLLLVQLNVGDRPRFLDSQNLRVQLSVFHRFCPPHACYATHGKTGRIFLAAPFLPWNSAITPSVERITETPTKRVPGVRQRGTRTQWRQRRLEVESRYDSGSPSSTFD
jgi:hypothetical protein